MATSAIQSKYDVTTAAASNKTVTLDASPSVGSLIVVVIAQYYSADPTRSISSVEDGAAAAYSLCKKAGTAGDTQTTDVYYRVATSTNAAITVTLSGNATFAVAVVEFPSTYSTYDDANSSTNTGNGTSPQSATPGSVTQGSTSLYVNAIGWNDQYTSASVPTGFDEIVNQGGAGGVIPIFAADAVTSGAQNPSSTLTGFTHYWADVIVTFTGSPAANNQVFYLKA